jgi:hypothetical protein
MEKLTFNPLFDYKGIARNALEGIGLDSKYMQEPLPKGLSIGEEIIPDDTPVQGISIGREITYQASEGAELIPDYVNGIAESMVKRKKALADTVKSYESGDSGIVKANFATAATGIGAGVDVLAETGTLALKGLSIIIPDEIEEPVKDAMKTAFKFMGETAVGQEGLKALQKGVGHWKRFENKYPEYAKIIGGGVNLGLLFTPLGKKKTDLEPRTTNTYAGTYVVGSLEEAAEKQIATTARNRVDALLQPEKTTDRIQNIKNINIAGKDLGDKRGILGLQRIQENEFELFRNNLVANIGGVKGKDTIVNTANAVRTHNQKKAQKLMDDLENTNITWNFPQGTQTELAKRVDDILGDINYIKGDAAMENIKKNTLESAYKIINNMENSPAGLLRARQAFDKLINKQLADNLFDPKVMNPTNDVANAVRKSINDLIESRVSGTNVQVKQSLKEQHALWNAQNILDIKAVKEGNNRISQIFQNLSPIVDGQLALNRTIAVFGGMSAFSAVQFLALPIAGVGVAYGVGLALTSGTLSLSGKRALGSILSNIDKGLRITSNENMLRQLKLDRAYIADLMKQPLTKEDESFAVN